jgi:hypothetical protein
MRLDNHDIDAHIAEQRDGGSLAAFICTCVCNYILLFTVFFGGLYLMSIVV